MSIIQIIFRISRNSIGIPAVILLMSLIISGCNTATETESNAPVTSLAVSPNTLPTATNEPTQSANTQPSQTAAPVVNTRPGSIIPTGWVLTQIGVVEGDLNKDGLSDQAVVVQEKEATELDQFNRYTPKRMLIIRFANADGGFTEVIRTERAILKASEGGVIGDPFSTLEIKDGSLFFGFYGGSRERWSHDFQFRYQDNDLYLIGATFVVEDTLDPANNTLKEYNLLTGEMIQATADETGKWIETKSKRAKKTLIKLQDFEVRTIQEMI